MDRNVDQIFAQIQELYERLIAEWNARSGAGMASLFAQDGTMIGFDGSTIENAANIELSFNAIFASYATPPFVSRVNRIRFLTPDIAVLQAIAGMAPTEQKVANELLNSVQTLIAQRKGKEWRIALLQNTPAAFHGHPELRARASEELK